MSGRRRRGGDGCEAARGRSVAAAIGSGGAHPLVVGLALRRADGRDQGCGEERAQEGAGARHLGGGVIDGCWSALRVAIGRALAKRRRAAHRAKFFLLRKSGVGAWRGALVAKMVLPNDAAWEEKLEALRAYVAAHGALPPQRHPSGLGQWVGNQRAGKNAVAVGETGHAQRLMTPAREAALEGVPGWTWAPRSATWGERLAELEAHVAAHGQLPARAHASGLGAWVHVQRRERKAFDAGGASSMTLARVAALEAVPGWAWQVDVEAIWQEKLAALEAHTREHGALPPRSHSSGFGAWVGNQRAAKRATDAGRPCSHRLTPSRIAALERVPGWAWEVDVEAAWQEKLAELEAHVRARGALPPARDPSNLGQWVNTQRHAKKVTGDARTGIWSVVTRLPGGSTKMTPERAAALERVPGWTWGVSYKRRRPDSPAADDAALGDL